MKCRYCHLPIRRAMDGVWRSSGHVSYCFKAPQPVEGHMPESDWFNRHPKVRRDPFERKS